MACFQLRPLPGNTWPALPEGTLAQLWAAHQELEHTQWLPPEEIEQGQLAQLRLLLGHCAAHVPYYRQWFAQHGLTAADIRSLADFRRLPIMPRRLYHEQLSQLTAAVLPHGTHPMGETTTSGTSGVQLKVLQTNIMQFWWLICYLRDLDWCGVDTRATIAGIVTTSRAGAAKGKEPDGFATRCWVPALQNLLDTGSSYGLDIQQDHARQLEWLRRINPDYLLSYPSNLEVLASLVAEDGRPLPRLRQIQSISETLTDEAKARIERGFGVPLKNLYSCTEAGYLASACPAGHGYHVHAENVLLEVLDEQDQPCPPGQRGRVVLTTLRNFRAPFIRYDIGDEVVPSVGRCPCGRGLPLLSRIEGKLRPMLQLPDGGQKSSSPIAMALHQLGGTRQYQFVQKARDHILMRLVPDANWTPDHGERMRRMIQDYFAAPIRVEVQLEARLQSPTSGKLQAFVSELQAAPGRG